MCIRDSKRIRPDPDTDLTTMAVATTDPVLQAAQHGDPAALEALLTAHREIVFRYGLRYCRTTEDAEDAVQETLWAAARSIRTFRRTAAITTWPVSYTHLTLPTSD